MERSELVTLLEQGWSLERMGTHFGKHPATVSYWLKKYGLEAAWREKHAARGPIERVVLEQLTTEGRTIAEIAEALGRSKATVRHWLSQYGLRTRNRVGRRPQHDFQTAREAGLTLATGICVKHGETMFVREGSGTYRCKRSARAGLKSFADRSRRFSWTRPAVDV